MKLPIVLSTLSVLLFSAPSFSSTAEADRIQTSTEVLQQIMAIPEKGIPPQLFSDAAGVAIIPNVIKVGFVVGGRHGRGVLLVRDEAGAWSDPVFISITAGSVGWQIGAQSTDVVLVFRNRGSVENILQGKFTLGADAAVAAGPVGRRVEGATDIELKAEIYSYSRSRGLFAGISLEGSSLQIDHDAVERFYGQDVRPRDVLEGRVKGKAEAEALHRQLDQAATSN